jgi:ribonuclease Z
MTTKVVVLGSGAAVPSIDRNLSSTGLRFNGRVHLFDCGEGTQRQMMRFGLSYAKVECVFVTHSHADHIVGIGGLAQTLDLIGRKEPLRIFCPKGAREPVEALLGIGKYGYEIGVSERGDGEVHRGQGYSVSAFPVKHSKPSLGYVFKQDDRRNFDKKKCAALGIKGELFGMLEEKGEAKVGRRKVRYEDVSTLRPGIKVAYTGDCLPSEETVMAAAGADLLVHEATYASDKEADAREKMHSTAAQAAEIARRAGVKRLALTHISCRYKDTDAHLREACAVFPETVVADDGTEFLL